MSTVPFLINGVSKADFYRLCVEVLSLPKAPAWQMSTAIFNWAEKSGLEWTNARLKELKTLFLNHLAGNLNYRLPRSNWIKCRKSDGSPKGGFHYLWTLLDKRGMAIKALRVLNVYTLFKLPDGTATMGQLRKFFDAVANPPEALVLPRWTFPSNPSVINHYIEMWYQAKYDTLLSWVSSPSSKTLHYSIRRINNKHPTFYRGYSVEQVVKGSTNNNKKYMEYCAGKTVQAFSTSMVCESELSIADHVADFLISCPSLAKKYINFFSQYIKEYPKNASTLLMYLIDCATSYDICDMSPGMPDQVIPVIGKIGFIQERGCKLRAVANPLRLVQFKLSRLKNWLQMVARTLPFDCTFDQHKGLRWAQEKLSQGIRLYSFDLSNASDTIPFDDQLDLLRRIGPDSADFKEDLQFYEDIVKEGVWINPYNHKYGDDLVAWSKGQPLGTACSFGSFSITHGMRIAQLCVDLGLDTNQFVVLGDDVVVTSDLADSYYKFVTGVWNCPISLPKSLPNGTLAEFASQIVDRKGYFGVVKYAKHTGMFNAKDLTDFFKRFGKRAINLIPRKLRLKAMLLLTAKRPLGLSYEWTQKELTKLNVEITSLHMISIDKNRERLDGTAYTRMFRRPGSVYKSVEIRSRQAVEKRAEAFNAFVSPFIDYMSDLSDINVQRTIAPGDRLTQFTAPVFKRRGRKKVLNEDSGDVIKLFQKVEPLEEIQFKVLHLNSNIDNSSPKLEKQFNDLELLIKVLKENGILVRNPFVLVDDSGVNTTWRVRKMVLQKLTILFSLYSEARQLDFENFDIEL